MSKTEARKESHADICIGKDVEMKRKKTGFEDIDFIQRIAPNFDFCDVDTRISLLGKKLSVPLIIEGMTGGHKKGLELNRAMARVAQELGLGMGVGSQRAMLENRSLTETYMVRDAAPDILLIGNIGIAQLEHYSTKDLLKCIENIEADALAIHFNILQELVQPEGDRKFRGIAEKMRELADQIPIIAKETGYGISREDAVMLEQCGVKAIDVGGAGGTSWAFVEHYRGADISSELFEWGIPTAQSIVEVSRAVKIPVIGSGGLRSGIDVAKAIALGATACGAALPFFKKAVEGEKALKNEIDSWIYSLKVAMFLTGCKNIEELKKAKILITGKTAERLCLRGINIAEFASR
ncbi:MAG: type 2 isopentenyl-diphosphate Delta-isomerase [Candidatus Micrarchaeia archaeon]